MIVGGQLPGGALRAFDATTAEPTPAPVLPSGPGNVGALLHDNGVLYVGGGFENGLLAFDAATLAPIAMPAVTGWVQALTVRNGVLYLGGVFDSVGGLPRRSLAAIRLSDRVVLPWAPNAGSAYSLTASASAIYAAGVGTIEGVQGALAALDPTTGALLRVLGPAPNGSTAYALLVTSAGLEVGGSFQSIGGVAQSNLARFASP